MELTQFSCETHRPKGSCELLILSIPIKIFCKTVGLIFTHLKQVTSVNIIVPERMNVIYLTCEWFEDWKTSMPV